MVRATKTSSRAKIYADRALKTSRSALLKDICEGMYKEFVRNNNRLPYGHVTQLLNALKPQETWISRNIINKAFIKFREDIGCRNELSVPENIGTNSSTCNSSSNISDISNVSSTKSNKIGRPVGTTEAQKLNKRKRLIAAKNEITQKYLLKYNEAKKQKKNRVERGTLVAIINDVKKARKVEDNISPEAIRKRVQRNSLENHHLAGGQVSPLQKIEPIIVSIIVQMARMRQSLTPSKGLLLINSLIKGSKIQDELIRWKNNNTPNCIGTVGIGYWSKFMKRHKDKIVSKRGQKYELNRQNWTTYNNFVQIYNHIIEELVNAGVTERLDEPV